MEIKRITNQKSWTKDNIFKNSLEVPGSKFVERHYYKLPDKMPFALNPDAYWVSKAGYLIHKRWRRKNLPVATPNGFRFYYKDSQGQTRSIAMERAIILSYFYKEIMAGVEYVSMDEGKMRHIKLKRNTKNYFIFKKNGWLWHKYLKQGYDPKEDIRFKGSDAQVDDMLKKNGFSWDLKELLYKKSNYYMSINEAKREVKKKKFLISFKVSKVERRRIKEFIAQEKERHINKTQGEILLMILENRHKNRVRHIRMKEKKK